MARKNNTAAVTEAAVEEVTEVLAVQPDTGIALVTEQVETTDEVETPTETETETNEVEEVVEPDVDDPQSKNPILRTYRMSDLMAQAGGNKSAVIRRLHAEGYSNGDIHRAMGILYQFVRNVLVADAQRKEAKARQG